MQFVEQYLNGFVNNARIFKNREENKLTFEVFNGFRLAGLTGKVHRRCNEVFVHSKSGVSVLKQPSVVSCV